MSKKFGELDWSELYKSNDEEYSHEPTALWAADQHSGGKLGVDPLNKAKPVNAPGEIPRKPSNEEIASYILKGLDSEHVGQWKDENHLHKEVVTQEQAEQLQSDWENALDNFYKAAQAPVVPQDEQKLEWGDGGSFNDTLTEEERLKRNMYTDD